jgi:hypothetical protein
VDLVGIEPTTSSMPWKRAPSCATGPLQGDATLLLSPLWADSSNLDGRCVQMPLAGAQDPRAVEAKWRIWDTSEEDSAMQAAVVNVLGEAPKYQSFAEPVAGEGEVVIAVRAAGLHPVVKARASGAHYSSDGVVPLIPGVDGVGVLDGRRVYFGYSRAPFGSMAERTLTRRSMSVPLPDGIDDVQAAAIANPGMSAWVSLKERAHLAVGEDCADSGRDGRSRANGDPGGEVSGGEAGDWRGTERGGACGREP